MTEQKKGEEGLRRQKGDWLLQLSIEKALYKKLDKKKYRLLENKNERELSNHSKN